MEEIIKISMTDDDILFMTGRKKAQLSRPGLTKAKIIDELWKISSYNRFEAFIMMVPYLDGRKYWHALGFAYTNSDNLFFLRFFVRLAFLSKNTGRDSLMTKSEKAFLNNLPEKITIYRGMTVEEYNGKEFGVSWTLDIKKAKFFAFKYGRNHDTQHLKRKVHSLEIDKKDVIAYFEGRGESEIIYVHPS